MNIRLIARSDAEAIREIYNHEVLGSTVTFDLEPRSAEGQLAWMEAHDGVHPALVACEEDLVVGFASLSPYRERPAYKTTVEVSIYVHRNHRGKGIGKRLMSELVKLAVEHGFHTIIARVGEKNERSMALHTSQGFELVGIEREIGRKFNRWLDVAILQLML